MLGQRAQAEVRDFDASSRVDQHVLKLFIDNTI